MYTLFATQRKWPTHQSPLYHWLPDNTGTAPFEKVIGQLAEAALLLTAVERARQRKNNKGKNSERANDETNSGLCSLETRA